MDIKYYAIVFTTIFLAELGDKTQLATVLFSTQENSNVFLVFIAASLALICATALAVLAGGVLAEYVNPQLLEKAAAVLFIAIGVFMLVR